MQADGYKKTQEWNDNLFPAHPGMAHIAKRGSEASGKGRMAQPAQNYSTDDQKHQEFFEFSAK